MQHKHIIFIFDVGPKSRNVKCLINLLNMTQNTFLLVVGKK